MSVLDQAGLGSIRLLGSLEAMLCDLPIQVEHGPQATLFHLLPICQYHKMA